MQSTVRSTLEKDVETTLIKATKITRSEALCRRPFLECRLFYRGCRTVIVSDLEAEDDVYRMAHSSLDETPESDLEWSFHKIRPIQFLPPAFFPTTLVKQLRYVTSHNYSALKKFAGNDISPHNNCNKN